MRVFEAFSEGQNQGIISAGWVFDRSVVKGAMTQLVAPITDDLSDMKRMRKEARPSVCSSTRLELVDVWRRCFLMTVMCFFFGRIWWGGWFCGYQLRDLQNYMLFRSRTTNIWWGGSQSHECVSMTYFEDCLSNQLLVVVFCWKVKGWWGPTFPNPQILRTCPRHHHPPPKSSEH